MFLLCEDCRKRSCYLTGSCRDTKENENRQFESQWRLISTTGGHIKSFMRNVLWVRNPPLTDHFTQYLLTSSVWSDSSCLVYQDNTCAVMSCLIHEILPVSHVTQCCSQLKSLRLLDLTVREVWLTQTTLLSQPHQRATKHRGSTSIRHSIIYETSWTSAAAGLRLKVKGQATSQGFKTSSPFVAFCRFVPINLEDLHTLHTIPPEKIRL